MNRNTKNYRLFLTLSVIIMILFLGGCKNNKDTNTDITTETNETSEQTTAMIVPETSQTEHTAAGMDEPTNEKYETTASGVQKENSSENENNDGTEYIRAEDIISDLLESENGSELALKLFGVSVLLADGIRESILPDAPETSENDTDETERTGLYFSRNNVEPPTPEGNGFFVSPMIGEVYTSAQRLLYDDELTNKYGENYELKFSHGTHRESHILLTSEGEGWWHFVTETGDHYTVYTKKEYFHPWTGTGYDYIPDCCCGTLFGSNETALDYPDFDCPE